MLRKPGYFFSLMSRRHLNRMQTSPSTDSKETYKSWQNDMSTACTIGLSYPITIRPKNKNIRNKIRVKSSIKHGKRIFKKMKIVNTKHVALNWLQCYF